MGGELQRAGRKKREARTPDSGITASPKSRLWEVFSSVSPLPFSLENYVTSQGEQRLPKPPNNTEIARREIPEASFGALMPISVQG